MIEIFTDFDGTITNRDSIVFLTEKFGGGSVFRRNVLARIKSGEISVYQAIEEELGSLRLSWQEAVVALKQEITVDPSFPEFVDWCRLSGVPLSVVSSGLKPVLALFLGELKVPMYAHDVEIRPQGWTYRRSEENEKLRILARASAQSRIVYVGDGASDVAVVPAVDVLFAKSYLADYCAERGIPFRPFRDFRDVRLQLEGMTSS